jgi:hypothetical protein
MFMQKTNFTENIERFIQNIEQINLADIDACGKIENEFSRLPFIPHFTIPVAKGYKFYRCRLNRATKYFESVKKLTYPPAHKISNFGRCNFPKQSVFYCAENELYSFIELLRTLDNELSTGDSTNITISEWELLDNLRLAVVLNPAKTILMERYSQIFENDFKWTIEQQPEEEREGVQKFFYFLAEKYSQSSTGDKSIYKLTSFYTRTAFKKRQIEGLIYPSVQYHSYGINFALRPKVVGQNKIAIRSVIRITYTKGKQDNGLSDFIQVPELQERAIKITGNRIKW